MSVGNQKTLRTLSVGSYRLYPPVKTLVLVIGITITKEFLKIEETICVLFSLHKISISFLVKKNVQVHSYITSSIHLIHIN